MPTSVRRGVTKKEIWTTLDSLAAMRDRDDTIELWEAYRPEDIDLLLPMDRRAARRIAKAIRARGSG